MRGPSGTRTVAALAVALALAVVGCQASGPLPTTEPSTATVDGKYGLGVYNTQEVVDELIRIEQSVEPLTPKPDTRILITGSTAGLGELTAKALLAKGYRVVVHARNEQRAADVRRDLPEAEAVVVGDLADVEQVKRLADEVNALGRFDVVIHNAGIYEAASPDVFRVNSLAPYLLTCLIDKPKRLVYLSSNMHTSGSLRVDDLRAGDLAVSYSDSKLQVLTLAMAVARNWPDVRANAVHPGWVPTQMGGSGAPDDLRAGYLTQVWLAEGTEPGSDATGGYFFHQQPASFNPVANDPAQQDALLAAYAAVSGVAFPS